MFRTFPLNAKVYIDDLCKKTDDIKVYRNILFKLSFKMVIFCKVRDIH